MKIEVEVLEVEDENKALSVFETATGRRVTLYEEDFVTFEVSSGKPIVLEHIDITPPDPDAVILGDSLEVKDGLG